MKKIKARLVKKQQQQTGFDTPAALLAREIFTEKLRSDDSPETLEYREKLLRGEELSFEDTVELAAIEFRKKTEGME